MSDEQSDEVNCDKIDALEYLLESKAEKLSVEIAIQNLNPKLKSNSLTILFKKVVIEHAHFLDSLDSLEFRLTFDIRHDLLKVGYQTKNAYL